MILDMGNEFWDEIWRMSIENLMSKIVFLVGSFNYRYFCMMQLPNPDETICALATAPGVGAIAVIRVSGKEAFSIV